ncbi:MAG: helix-turn-helix domain-containing protein [Planctomycetes bacterium]|nr:helix-turn-helix domain-containing protein [Planctomycetota bacterium]
MASQSNSLLLTADQTLEFLGGEISSRSLWRWAKEGIFPKPVKLGGRTLWRRKEVEAFINDADGDIKRLNQLKRGKP